MWYQVWWCQICLMVVNILEYIKSIFLFWLSFKFMGNLLKIVCFFQWSDSLEYFQMFWIRFSLLSCTLKQMTMLYTHLKHHNDTIIKTQWQRRTQDKRRRKEDAGRLLYKNIYLSLYCKGSKGLFEVCM